MYLLSIKKLKNSILAGQFSEADRFKYLFVFLLIETLLYEYVSTFARPDPEWWDYLSLLLSVTLVAGGTYAAYLANGAAAGRDFVARYFAVNLVVTCRFMLISLPLYMGWIVYLIQNNIEFSEEDQLFDLLFTLCWGALLYYRIYRHMADLKEPVGTVTN